jgi:hypothetical protein
MGARVTEDCGMALRTALAAPVLAAGVLLLGGCAAPEPVPPGLTDAQADAVAAQTQADLWAASSYRGDVPFPNITPLKLVGTESWASIQVTCLLAAGLPAREVSGGYAVDGDGPLSRDDSALAQATCLAQYPVDPRENGYLSDAQGLYMYDYFTERLAPCLRLLGFDSGIAPDRYQYLGLLRAGIIWTPYNDTNAAPIRATTEQWAAINARCPPLPVDPFGAYQPPVAG